MIADRYVLTLFVRVITVSFLSLAGVLIVFDAVGSLDDFIAEGKKQGSTIHLLLQYYGPQLAAFFDKAGGLIAMTAAVFTVSLLQRSNEMTAVRAAGVPQTRVIKPLILAAAIVSLLGVVNRETLIPRFRNQLTRKVQDWSGETGQKLRPRYDHISDILISGRYTYAVDRRIEAPNLRLHRTLGGFHRRIVAEAAYHQSATADHSAGYLLKKVTQPENLSEIPSFRRDGKVLIHSPQDTPWLAANECFVVSDVGFEQLSASNVWRLYASSAELMSGLKNRSLDYGADVKVTLHARMVQPLLDMTLFFLGLPVVLSRKAGNVFVTAGICIGIVIAFFLVIMSFHAIGSSGYLISPATAAWCPLLILGPIAYTVARPLWQ